jgi:hypothetical protein
LKWGLNQLFAKACLKPTVFLISTALVCHELRCWVFQFFMYRSCLSLVQSQGPQLVLPVRSGIIEPQGRKEVEKTIFLVS